MFSLLRAFHVISKLSYIGSEGVEGGQGMHWIFDNGFFFWSKDKAHNQAFMAIARDDLAKKILPLHMPLLVSNG